MHVVLSIVGHVSSEHAAIQMLVACATVNSRNISCQILTFMLLSKSFLAYA